MKNFYFVLLLTLTMTSCKKEATVWESDWSAPVLNDTLNLANLVNDSTLGTSGGYYTLDLKRTLFDLSIDDVVSIPDTTIDEVYVPAFLSLQVQPGTTFAGSSETHDLSLGDLQLKVITMKNGFVDFHLENPVPTKVYFLVKLPGVTKDGAVFLKNIEAPPGSTSNPGIVNTTIDLTGYSFDLKGIGGGSFNKLISEISVTTNPSGPQVTVTNQDITKVSVTFRDIGLFYAQGYFGNQVISDTTEVDLSALDVYESGSVDISNLSLNIEVENGVKVGAMATIHTIKNENVNGTVVALSGLNIGTGITVNPATGSWENLNPSVTNLSFSSMNSNIEAYLENLGTKHTIGYSFQLNPWGNVSGGWDQIFPSSRIKVNLRAQMPLSLGLDDLVLRDTFDISLNQDPEKTRVVSGNLILKAKNGFPFNGEVVLYFLGENNNLLHTVSASDKIESAQYGSLDTQTGILVKSSEVLVSLGEDVVADINEIKKVVVRAKFNSPNANSGLSQSMLIPVNAFLHVKLKTQFKTENRF